MDQGLGIQGIMVADDEAASNEMQKMTLKMAVPDGIKCIIKTVPEIIALLIIQGLRECGFWYWLRR